MGLQSCKELQGDSATKRAWTPQTAAEELTGSQSETRWVSILLGGPGGHRGTETRRQCQVPAHSGREGKQRDAVPTGPDALYSLPMFSSTMQCLFQRIQVPGPVSECWKLHRGVATEGPVNVPWRVAGKGEFPV